MGQRGAWRLRRIGALCLLIVLSALAGEVFFALRYGYGNPRRMVASPELGYRLAASQRSSGARGCVEFVNAHGYRDREWLARDADGPVVLVLGDTAAYGQGVPVEQTWPRVLEDELRTRQPGALVRRMAVPGYALEQMLGAYAFDGRALAPAVVVLELHPSSVRPMLVLHEPQRFPLQSLLQTSALWDWIRREWLVRPRDDDWTAERSALSEPYAAANDALWAEARARLADLRVELAARGAHLVLVAAPQLGTALDPATEDPRWRDWAREHGVTWVSSAQPLHAALEPVIAELERRGLAPAQVWNRDADVARSALESGGDTLFFSDDPVHIDAAAQRLLAQAVGRVLGPLLPAPEHR